MAFGRQLARLAEEPLGRRRVEELCPAAGSHQIGEGGVERLGGDDVVARRRGQLVGGGVVVGDELARAPPLARRPSPRTTLATAACLRGPGGARELLVGDITGERVDEGELALTLHRGLVEPADQLALKQAGQRRAQLL